MITNNLWIKKYNYIRGLGHLYLIADFKKINEVPHIMVHEITVDFKRLDNESYDHNAYKYNLKEHFDHEIPLGLIVKSIFERHQSSVLENSEIGDDLTTDLRPFKEIETGKSALYDLQFTRFFKELKVQILKESRSDSFSNLLNNLVHLPLRIESTEESTKNLELADMVGTS